MPNSNSCSEILTLVTQIVSILPPTSVESAKKSVPVHIYRLSFVVPRRQELILDLSKLGVTDVCQDALLQLFFDQLVILQRAFEDEYERAVTTLQQGSSYEESHHIAFRNSLTRLLSANTHKMWNLILEAVVRHRRKGFSSDVSLQESTLGHDESCIGGVLKNGRGHDSDAVRILEQAFEHTPNITQAEKFQLAEATGLQPKQVTIWFQNRRNRKGKKGPKPAITSQSGSDPSFFKNESPPASPTRDFTLSEKKRKSYGALGRASLDSSSYDSDSPSSLSKKPRLPSADSDVSDGSASSYEHHGAFTCWSTPSSRSNSSSLDSSGMSDFDSPRKPRNVFDYMKPRTLDVQAITSMPRLTIPAPQQHASTNATGTS